MDGVGLGLMNGAVAVGPQRQRRQPDGFDLGAELLQRGDRLLDGADLVGIGFGVIAAFINLFRIGLRKDDGSA